MPDSRIQLGVIGRAHGVRGLVKVTSHTADPADLTAYGPLSDAEGRLLTLRWCLFFLAMALVNELAWRNLSTDAWVNVKVFGYMPAALLFGMAQVPALMRHQKDGGGTA